jgi:hypothetical protein
MAETALCRYHCPNCQAELEQEGYIIIDALDEGPVEALFSGEVNIATCPQCGNQMRLPIPLIYHNGEQQLLIAYVPNAGEMSQEDLTQTIEYPYSMTVTNAAERMGIELPEPDAAAFPRGEEYRAQQPGARFASLTQEQAAQLLPEYLLRPTIVDGIEVLVAVAQAVREGMSAQEVLEDMSRLQVINSIISAPDPIARRKVLHHAQPYLNDELFVVIDTLRDQMTSEGNTAMVEKLDWVRGEVERYKKSLQERLKKGSVPKQ